MNKIMIEGRPVFMPENYLDPVTYVPGHALGDASHADCETGVILNLNKNGVMVLYCKSRTAQTTSPEDLVWG